MAVAKACPEPSAKPHGPTRRCRRRGQAPIASRAGATVNRRGVQVIDVLLQRALGGELAVFCVELRRGGQPGKCNMHMQHAHAPAHAHARGVCTHAVARHVHGMRTGVHSACTPRAGGVHAVCTARTGRVRAMCMLRTLLQGSARVLDRVVRVLQPVGHLLTKQVPREEAQRDAAGAGQVEEVDLGDGTVRWRRPLSRGAPRRLLARPPPGAPGWSRRGGLPQDRMCRRRRTMAPKASRPDGSVGCCGEARALARHVHAARPCR